MSVKLPVKFGGVGCLEEKLYQYKAILKLRILSLIILRSTNIAITTGARAFIAVSRTNTL